MADLTDLDRPLAHRCDLRCRLPIGPHHTDPTECDACRPYVCAWDCGCSCHRPAPGATLALLAAGGIEPAAMHPTTMVRLAWDLVRAAYGSPGDPRREAIPFPLRRHLSAAECWLDLACRELRP